jgi:hypothetical protein
VDKITENLLTGFSKENGIQALPEETRFEHLAAFLTVRRHYSRALDSSDLVTGAGGDTGLGRYRGNPAAVVWTGRY